MRVYMRKCSSVKGSALFVGQFALLTALEKGNMRILAVGAGAIGGYFGGRLLEAAKDAGPGEIRELATAYGLSPRISKPMKRGAPAKLYPRRAPDEHSEGEFHATHSN